MKGICFRVCLALSFFPLTEILGAQPHTAAGALLWLQNVDGTTFNGFDMARSVVVDKQGNVVAAGSTENTVTSSDFTVAKFDRAGTLLWRQNLNGTANGSDIAKAVAVDKQGNVVAAGETLNTGTSSDFTVVKFDGDGTVLWQQNLNGTAPSRFNWDSAEAVAVDNQGNVVAAGFLRNQFIPDLTVAKFDRNGSLLWQHNIAGTDFDKKAVAVDNRGNIVVAASVEQDFTVAKFDGDGTLLWQQNLNGTAAGGDSAASVAVDIQGNVVASGLTRNTLPGGSDFTVAKFDRDGTLLWQHNLHGTTVNGSNNAASVELDHAGNVVAAGAIENTSSGFDFTVAKFDRNGTLLWQQVLNGTFVHSYDIGTSVAVDNQRNVVAAGYMQNSISTGDEFTVAKFDRDGTLLWQQSLGGNGGAFSMALDKQGDVIAAGDSHKVGASSDFTVAKFAR
jgi:uncharacterized delta-60 repeat protein